MIFQANFKVTMAFLNKQNKLSNKGLLSLFNDTAEMHSASIGFGVTDILKTDLSWALLNWKVKILKRPSHNDDVIVQTWVRRCNKLFCYRDFELLTTSGETLAIATSKWVLIDSKNHKIVKLRNDIIENYRIENKQVFDDEESNELPKLEEIDNYSHCIDYTIRKADIDLNNHVHNLCYLDMAEEILPYQISNSTEAQEFEIWFKYQIKFEDSVSLYYGLKNNKHYVVIKSNNGEYLHNIMKFY